MFTQFPIANKLALICGTFSLPIAVLLFLMVSGINDHIEFARKESYGIHYQRVLEKLLQHLSEHKQARYALVHGQQDAQRQTAQLAQRLDADFKTLIEVDSKLGGHLQTTPSDLAQRKREHLLPQTLQQEWARLKDAAPAVAYRDHLHDPLIADVRGLISHVGDVSNMILDPDLDSYYLMDITLLTLPPMQDHLQQVLAYGQQMVARKRISPEQQARLYGDIALLKQSYLEHINTSAQTAFNEDPNFYGASVSLHRNLPPLLRALSLHTDDFIQLNTRLGAAGAATISLNQYQASAERALQSSYHLWEGAATELDALLAIRIAHYQYQRLVALLLTLLALLTAILLAVLIIVRGIIRPMRGLFNSIAVELEQQVAQRTAELEVANKELGVSNKELESFCYSVSHDLRAPLRGIDGFSQALLVKYPAQLDERGRHYLQRIRAGTQRMGQLIDDLLNLSRVTRQEMRAETVMLSALAHDVAEELRKTQPQRAVEFRIQENLQAQGDAHLLGIALQNLLDNAWKYTAKHAHARIEFGLVERQGEAVYFVRDDGAGFDMAYAGKLFGAFQRLHNETEFPGIGIGLATVQRIIHRHGGRIWAESAPEQGATFYFTLPT